MFVEVVDRGGEGVENFVCAGFFWSFGLGVEEGVESVYGGFVGEA